MGGDRTLRACVIDDSSEFVDVLRDLLADAGWSVQVLSGDEASVERLAAYEPEVIILDIRLLPPALPGDELLRLIRTHPTLHDTRIVIVTADQRWVLNEAMAIISGDPMTHVLLKPFELAKLERLVLRGSSGRAPDTASAHALASGNSQQADAPHG